MLKLKEKHNFNIDSLGHHTKEALSHKAQNSPFAVVGVSPIRSAVDLAALLSHPNSKYFSQKLADIKRLEIEIYHVERMNEHDYRIYRDGQGNCPLLKTKSALISNNMFFIKHYWRQICNVFYRE